MSERQVRNKSGLPNAEDPQAQTDNRAPEETPTYGSPTASAVARRRRGNVAQYDPLIEFQEEQRRLRDLEGRRMDDLIRLYESEPDRLRQAQGVATDEMRRQAALRMAQQGGRGNVIGAMSAAKGVGQEAENIGTRFGAQIRDAARTAAQARADRAQQRIESLVKPGVDAERVSAELRSIIDRNERDFKNMATFGYYGRGASPQARDDELAALERTTSDPVALQMIRLVRSNIEQGMDPFAGMAQA